jgi:predicted ribosome quality control (RQC) complex YloA/Tae2 family protein
MNLATLEKIIPELRAALVGRRFGKIFPLSRFSLAVDFRLQDSQFLFVSVEPANPRIYLFRRRLRDLEKQSVNPSPFIMQSKKLLSGFDAASISQITGERALKVGFQGVNEVGNGASASWLVQLTGRSSNLFLLDENDRIVDALRETREEGQQIAEIYAPPIRPSTNIKRSDEAISIDGFASISEALDTADLERAADAEFRSLANAARAKVDRQIAKLEKLRSRLNGDLDMHGDTDRWKRFGDLLLANVATAKREGPSVIVTDYFDESVSSIAIEVDENASITEAAEKYFRKYTKARNARVEIAKRIEVVEAELQSAAAEKAEIESAIEIRDVDFFRDGSAPAKQASTKKQKARESANSSAARTFVSSDGFEILVGKRAKDNDQLTFKIAKSLDTWMHAADYPGSHVVVRNPNRKEIPHSTLLEAAQLAAFYSQGKAQPKAAVHYTQKKFVNKPKGSAPGLVSLSSFKTLLVEPAFPESVVKKDLT